MNLQNERLAVVMPVYNEAEIVASVLQKWRDELERLCIDYHIHVYNDGSRDNTLSVLQQAAAIIGPRIVVHDQKNAGHGPTILRGYRDNCSSADWIFQIDSDDEMEPSHFGALWNNRENYDFLLGVRGGRRQPLPRKLVTLVSRKTVNLFYGNGINDVNSPYRLMRCSVFKSLYSQIPDDTFAPNLIISGMAAKNITRCFQSLVPQRERHTGEVSIKRWRLFKAAVRSLVQTISFSIKKTYQSR